jgi:hypothetical protein
MATALFRLGEDSFIEWSTVTDAPVSWLMTKHEALERYPVAVVERADRLGHSFPDVNEPKSPIDLIDGNRAGPNESAITLRELIEMYGDRRSYERLRNRCAAGGTD